MEQIIEVRKWGNSGGVLVSRDWLGKQVKVILIDRTSEIKKEVLNILEPYLEDIIGIYLVGSYARGDQGKNSDIDILVVSKELSKFVKSGKYEITIVPKKDLKWTIKNNPVIVYPKIIDAKPIMNNSFLEEIRDIDISRNSIKSYLEECKSVLKIDKELIEEDKLEGEFLQSQSVVYSSVLRLRALHMMNCVFNNEKYSNMKFKKWLMSKLGINDKEYTEIYEIYNAVRDNKKVRTRLKIELAERLWSLLRMEVLINGKKEKKT